MLERLAVFAGGWTLEAAETVCSSGNIEDWEVLDHLTSLTDKNLVIAEQKHGHTRYQLLETVRQYARDRLLERGGGEVWRDRHLAYFIDLAEQAEPQMARQEQNVWFSRLETEHDNFRAALTWACKDGSDPESGLQLVGCLWWFWHNRADSEGRTWCQLVLEKDGKRTRRHAEVLNGAGTLAYGQGDYAAARSHFEESLTITYELGNRRFLADLLEGLGGIALAESAPGRTARLKGAAALLREQLGVGIAPPDQRWFDQWTDTARQAIGADAFDRAWAEGRALMLEQVIALAVERTN